LNTLSSYKIWWKSLSPQWRQAFSLSVLQKQDEPTNEDLETLKKLQVLRLAGPEAPYPNCVFELNDLSGITELNKLEILIITHHNIESIEVLAQLPSLKAIFLLNNHIKSLKGIESLFNLEQLYVQCNQISSIKEIEQLLNLREFYIHDNKIVSLEGLTEAHSDKLRKLVCQPNELLKQKEIIHAERELGIICR
jgi:Leucine-rich repeat (LRR) protein